MKKNIKTKAIRIRRTGRWRPIPLHLRHDVKPGDTDAKNCKVRVTMFLDLDILEFFKARAASPNAPAYQTQINAELRRVMEQTQVSAEDPVTALNQATSLINAAREHIEANR